MSSRELVIDLVNKLPENMRYRHVRFELRTRGSIDHSWEREWRIRADELPVNPTQATLVVPSRKWKESCSKRVTGNWHFIVLEDLGVEVPRYVATSAAV